MLFVKSFITQLEKNMAAIEMIKLHQLVITENQEENLIKPIGPSDALDEGSIDDAVACLIATNDETVDNDYQVSQDSIAVLQLMFIFSENPLTVTKQI